jgi:AcrR family transcriptional regulator
MTTFADLAADAPLRERVLTAAFQAFMEHGYAGASTLDIATRAKVSKRELYALFGSKQAMLRTCIAERAARMRLPLSLPAPDSRDALVATLVVFGRTLLTEMSRPEVLAIYRLAVLEAERAPDVARTLDSEGRGATLAALGRLLAAAQVAGLLGPGDTVEMAETFISILWGRLLIRLLLRVAPSPGTEEVARRARAAAMALLRLHPPEW